MGQKFIIEVAMWIRSMSFPSVYTRAQAVHQLRRKLSGLTAEERARYYRIIPVEEDSDCQPAKLPIDRPCSACSAGDFKMEYHLHEPPFRTVGKSFVAELLTSPEQQVIEASIRAWRNNDNPWYDGLSFSKWLDCKNYWIKTKVF